MVRKPVTRRRHSAAFKLEAVQLMKRRLAASVPMHRISQELDLAKGLLWDWARAVADAPAGASADEIFPGSGRPRQRPAAPAAAPPAEPPEAEVRRLRRENGRLRIERDFLKKAAAFFAKE